MQHLGNDLAQAQQEVGSLNVVAIKDPELDIPTPAERHYNILKGGSDIQYYLGNAQSNTVMQQVSFSSIRPPAGVVVSRRFFIRYRIRVNIGAPNANAQDLFNNTDFGLRPFPLNNYCDVSNIKLNTQTISDTPNRYIQYLMKYNSTIIDRNNWLSGSPYEVDEIPAYTAGAGGFYAGARNPFASYTANPNQITRQLYNYVIEYQVGAAPDFFVTSFVMEFIEPLFSSPLNWTDISKPGFRHLNSIDITLTNASNSAPVISKRLFCGGIAGTGIPACLYAATTTYSFADTPSLLLKYIQDNSSNVEPVYLYPYFKVSANYDVDVSIPQTTRALGAVAGGWNGTDPATQLVSVTSNSYIWSEVPRLIYLFVVPKQENIDNPVEGGNNWTYSVPQLPARIVSCSIRWNARDALLSTASEFDLYQICARNGQDSSFPQVKNFNGTVLCINPSLDLGLMNHEVSGLNESINFSVQLKVVPMTYATTDAAGVNPRPNIPHRLIVCPVYEGVFKISQDMASVYSGILTPTDVLNATLAPHGTYNDQIHRMTGGGFWGSLWRKIKAAIPIIGKVAKGVASAVGTVAPLIPHPAAQMVGTVGNAVSQGLSALGAGRRAKRTRRYKGAGVISTGRLERRIE